MIVVICYTSRQQNAVNSGFFPSYFINHYTKTTSWEDPRVRYQQIGKPTSTPSTGSGTVAATASVASVGKENRPQQPSTSAVATSISAASASSSAAATRHSAVTAAAHPHWTASSSASARKNSAESASNLLSEAKTDSAQLQVCVTIKFEGDFYGVRSEIRVQSH